MTTESYQSYIEWKKWDKPQGELPKYRAQYFMKELAKTGVKPPARLFEIGFGKGEFLSWAKSNGCEVSGVEILEDLVQEGVKSGLDVMLGNPAVTGFKVAAEKFDLVIAFDVLEHLDIDEIRVLLENMSNCLKPGGKMLFRFPNAGSPFGQILLNGDYTHKTAMTKSKFEQVLIGTAYDLIWYGNTARVIHHNSPFAFLKYMTFWIRNLFEVVMGWAYYGYRVPMDKNSIAVLEHRV